MQGDCLVRPGMVRALRCQLPLHNRFYASSADRSTLPRQVLPHMLHNAARRPAHSLRRAVYPLF